VVEVVERMSPPPHDRWRELVQQDLHASTAHTPEWCAAVCEFTGYRDVTSMYRLSNGREFVVPMVRRRTQGLNLDFSMPRGWGYGGIVGPDLGADDIAAIVNHLDRGPLSSIAFRPNPLLVDEWDEAACRAGWTAGKRFPHLDHSLDLSGGYDRVWNDRFKKQTRNLVRRAERDPELTVSHARSGKLLDDFYGLHLKSVSRWRDHGENAKTQPKARFELVASVLGDRLHIWVAYLDARPAAAILVVDDGSTFTYSAGAIDESLTGNTGASYLLHALAIQAACHAGAGFYHMGETDEKSGLAQFKARLGAQAYLSREYIFERLPIRMAAEKTRGLRSAFRPRFSFPPHSRRPRPVLALP
jgi:hypothetical protein